MSRTYFLITLLLTACLLQIVRAQCPPTEDLCAGTDCTLLKSTVVESLEAELTQSYGAGPAQCGDGTCDILRGETCLTCPNDCGGPCKLGEPLKCCKNPNHFALTFDHMSKNDTLKTVEILTQYDIKATFFFMGVQVIEHPEVLRAVIDAGHVIGSYTSSHSSPENCFQTMDQVTPPINMQEELLTNEAVITDVIGKVPLFVRSPLCDISGVSTAFMETAGYTPVNVSAGSDDWHVDTPQSIVDVSQLKESLESAEAESSQAHRQHDQVDHFVGVLEKIIEHIKRVNEDIQFVPLDGCLGLPAYRENDDSSFLSNAVQDTLADAVQDTLADQACIPTALCEEECIRGNDECNEKNDSKPTQASFDERESANKADIASNLETTTSDVSNPLNANGSPSKMADTSLWITITAVTTLLLGAFM